MAHFTGGSQVEASMAVQPPRCVRGWEMLYEMTINDCLQILIVDVPAVPVFCIPFCHCLS